MIKFFTLLFSHTPLFYLTQSLWRDEAFSVMIAEYNPFEIIKINVFDFNPPFYYLLLHYWMKLFGNSEITLRLLSFIPHVLLTYFFYKFIKDLFINKGVKIFTLLVFFNPMLLYYSFEVRMYSLFALLGFLSFFFLYKKNYLFYILSTVLALYTHTFMFFYFIFQIFYLIIAKKINSLKIRKSILTIFLMYLPWMPVLLFQASRSYPTWVEKSSIKSLFSFFGNLFYNFDWYPQNYLYLSFFITFLILILSTSLLFSKQKKYSLFLIWLYLPAFPILLGSFFKPLFVNRYLILTTVAEIFVIVLAVKNIYNKNLAKILLVFIFTLSIFLNIEFVKYKRKADFQKTFTAINKLAKKDDLIYCATPLTFFESNYYFNDKKRVFVYNPYNISIPIYVGQVLIGQEKNKDQFPIFPQKAFLINDDGSWQAIFEK